MSEIKCPNCGKVFKIDEESYSLILQQARNSEFNKEIDEQLENKLKLALNESENGFRDKLYLKEYLAEHNITDILFLQEAEQQMFDLYNHNISDTVVR